MLHAIGFLETWPRGTVPMKSGSRIALQIQVERQPDTHYPGMFPEVYSTGIKMNNIDELFQFLN